LESIESVLLFEALREKKEPPRGLLFLLPDEKKPELLLPKLLLNPPLDELKRLARAEPEKERSNINAKNIIEIFFLLIHIPFFRS